MADPQAEVSQQRRKFLNVISAVVGISGLGLLPVYAIFSHLWLDPLVALGFAAIAGLARYFIKHDNLRDASRSLLYGATGLLFVQLIVNPEPDMTVELAICFTAVGLGCVLLDGRARWYFTAVQVAVFASGAARMYMADLVPLNEAITTSVAIAVILPINTGALIAFVSQFRGNVELLRDLVGQLDETADELSFSTNEIASMSMEQTQGAEEQAAAVLQIQHALETLLKFASEVSSSSQNVVGNAEQTLKNNELIASRFSHLMEQTHRIGEVLETINDIANTSEILALNAALEGVRAGDAGRGFSLVAGRMQQLSEHVMHSVDNVKSLVSGIEKQTRAAVHATEEGPVLASSTTETARHISIITEKQRASTEQVAASMDDIARVAEQVAVGSAGLLEASERIALLAVALQERLAQFEGEHLSSHQAKDADQ